MNNYHQPTFYKNVIFIKRELTEGDHLREPMREYPTQLAGAVEYAD